ncbi:MAG TPA: hypothetical protein VG225_00385 [Terracidiphilus sp.]|jgi:hypothetical protein|nr:hypothetical protein [Terracidiphilus sp.]
MKGKLWHFAAALLPICFLSAQEPSPQAPPQANGQGFRQPSPEALRQATEMWRRDRAHANAINDLAGHVQSLDDARKLVDLVAAEFSHELPPKWATRSIRSRIAHAEFESAADPGALIPEQHVADVWNDYLEKIGAPRESYVTAAEIHTLRDTYYVTSQLYWVRGHQDIWTVPNIYAVGPDGKVAHGCRALEVLNILWQLANQPDALQGTRDVIKKGQVWSDMYKNPSKPPAPGSERGYARLQVVQRPPNPLDQAALRYMHDHGVRALNHAIEGLLQDLFAG